MRKPPPPRFPIAPILEDEFGAEMVPRMVGARWRKMRCPFHDDRTPSASVSEFGFTCFPCGISGDAIKLLREQRGMDFESAVERADELTGGTRRDVPPESGWGQGLLD